MVYCFLQGTLGWGRGASSDTSLLVFMSGLRSDYVRVCAYLNCTISSSFEGGPSKRKLFSFKNRKKHTITFSNPISGSVSDVYVCLFVLFVFAEIMSSEHLSSV